MRAPAAGGGTRDPAIVVVGAGVIGVCTAWFLARRGARVVLLERAAVAAGASEGNAGTISPGHPPINRPGRFAQALRSLRNPSSPLYVAPRWDPALARWLWSFARHCGAEQVERGMAALAPLGRATPELFDEVIETAGIACDHRKNGYLEVYRTPAGLAAGREEAELIARHGFAPEELRGDALREREPSFGPGVIGGWHHPEGSTVNPRRFVVGLADACRAIGVELRTGTAVTGVRVETGRARGVTVASGEVVAADAVVVATGAYGGGLLGALGHALPVQPAKGYHLDRDPARPGTPPLAAACLFGEGSVFVTPMDGFVRFAGTLEFSGLNHEIRRDRLEQLTRVAARYLEGIGPAEPLDEWVGLRPVTPDGLPAIGGIPGREGLYVATGHGMLGLTLGPVTGRLLAETILDGRASLPLAPFDPRRFLR
jgi:D-amino-acid dehydrogenase